MLKTPTRIDGYAPIEDYAVLGDKRTAALVALDGSVDWLSPVRFDAPSVLGAVLDAKRGGRFALAPEAAYEAERRYLPDTNVLETTFRTDVGVVRVTDALSLPATGPLPWTELVRRVEGVEGEVPMRYVLEPRFEYGQDPGELGLRDGGLPVAAHGPRKVTLEHWDAGAPEIRGECVTGAFTARPGARTVLALGVFSEEPIARSTREAVDARLDSTAERWRRRAADVDYDGPWRDAVLRSVLAIDLLVFEPTGAMTAAATTSLPERIGSSRNFDYRYGWLRDTSFTLDALMRVGMREQAHATLSWMISALSGTAPVLQPFYDLDGHVQTSGQRALGFSGYRDSSPAYLGNSAENQLQLGNYGDIFDTCWIYVRDGNLLDEHTGEVLAGTADYLCEIWRDPDASIWELGKQHDYTQSKIACWVALDRACRLADAGQIPDGRVAGWRAVRGEIRAYIEERCFSPERNSYVRAADLPGQLDASVLLASRSEYADPTGERMNGTIDAIRDGLGVDGGPLLYRYSGMEEKEGAFLACSFWLVEALARAERLDEARELMDRLVGLGSDLGLYSEELDPESGEFRGNLPQALTHLALVNAAAIYTEAAGAAQAS